MHRHFLFCVFVSCFFGIGLLAGRGATAEKRSSHRSTQALAVDTTSPEIPESQRAMDDRLSSIFNASQSRDIDDVSATATAELHSDVFTGDQRSPVPETEKDTENVSNRDDIRKLILRMFPGAGDETVDSWTDAYSGMEPGEVEFILEQKRTVSGKLETELEGVLYPTPGLPGSADEISRSSSNSMAVISAIHHVEQNLRCASSVGYRRMVILPEARLAETNAEGTRLKAPHFTTFRSFDTGKFISSPLSLHVALPATEGVYMFCLERDLYTRRGDFQLLTDGRIGLVTSVGAYGLKDSPVIADSGSSVRIVADGRIQLKDSSDNMIDTGHVTVVRFRELNHLKSEDGVFFTNESGQIPEVVTTAEPLLLIHSLELSNSDRSEEKEVLGVLRSFAE